MYFFKRRNLECHKAGLGSVDLKSVRFQCSTNWNDMYVYFSSNQANDFNSGLSIRRGNFGNIVASIKPAWCWISFKWNVPILFVVLKLNFDFWRFRPQTSS